MFPHTWSATSRWRNTGRLTASLRDGLTATQDTATATSHAARMREEGCCPEAARGRGAPG